MALETLDGPSCTGSCARWSPGRNARPGARVAAQAGGGRGGGLLVLVSCGRGGELAAQDHAERLHPTLIAHGSGGTGQRAPSLATTALLFAVCSSPTFSPPIPPPDLS